MNEIDRVKYLWIDELLGEQGNTLGPTERLVGCAIANCMRADGRHAFPGGERLARKTGLSVRTVRRAVAGLRTKQALAVERRQRNSNVYRPLLRGLGLPRVAHQGGQDPPGMTHQTIAEVPFKNLEESSRNPDAPITTVGSAASGSRLPQSESLRDDSLRVNPSEMTPSV